MLGLKLNHVRKSGSWSTELSLKFNDGLVNRGVNSRLTKPSLKFNGVLVNWRLNCRLIKPALEFNGILANCGVASILTKPVLKFNAGLANLELTSSVSHTPGREYCCEWNRYLSFFTCSPHNWQVTSCLFDRHSWAHYDMQWTKQYMYCRLFRCLDKHYQYKLLT